MTQEEIRECLKEIGCNEKDIQKIFDLLEKGQNGKVKDILDNKRNEFLNSYHECADNIDKIDFLSMKL